MIDSAEVARAAKKGLVRAQSTYECWSGWWEPPPEYLATVSIARTVHRLESVRWVTLEHNVRDALREGRGGLGRPANSVPKQGRFDIVVWSARLPRGVIEVKTRGYSKLVNDVKRVCDTLRNTETIEWGLVAYLYACGDGEEKDGRDRVLDRIDGVVESAEAVVKKRAINLTRHRGRPRVRENGAWTAEVLEIRRQG